MKGAVSPQNAKGSEKGSAQAGVALARKGGPREEFTDGCGDSVVTKLPPPPGLAPVTHARPAPPRAPPASGTASRRARIGRQLPTSGRATRKQPHSTDEAAPSSRRKLPPEVEQATVSENLGTITRSGEHGLLPWRPVLPLGLLQSSPAVSL